MSEVSGSTPLTQRLVEAAAEAIAKAYAPGDSAMLADPCYWRVEGECAAVAVLMELARSGQVAWSDSLAALADSIERGE